MTSRYRTGRDDLDRMLHDLLTAAGVSANRDQLFESLVSVLGMGLDQTNRLDLKITNVALQEMREAFRVFAPYRHVPKITMFGSARTHTNDPLYSQARDFARVIAERGWMVVTGAGPGIMAAGTEGAGREKSFGVNIRLPFEQGANEFIAEDPKLVEMRYFFTRKLMLVKESDGFVVLPGGFGTLDELLELLTLLQTGKAEPAPIVLLDLPGGSYWEHWQTLARELAARGLVSPEDERLYAITDDVTEAVDEIVGFYRNYHSRRFVGERMVVRLQAAPTDEELEKLNVDFADLCASGRIERTEPTSAEVSSNDHLGLPRLIMHFDLFKQSRLRIFIDALNDLASAPSMPSMPPDTAPFRTSQELDQTP